METQPTVTEIVGEIPVEPRNVELDIEILQAHVRNLEAQLHTQPALLPQPSPQAQDHLWFIVLLALAIGATALLVAHGWADKPTVSIEYNVGEIIGGVLVGIGALIAALAYRHQQHR
jgi:hypothetical protein